MRELREDSLSGNKDEDAHNHIDRVLSIVGLFNILGVSKDAVMLRVFPFTLTGFAKRRIDRLALRTINTWDLLKKAFIQRYCPPSMTAKQLKDIHNFKNIGSSSSNDRLAALVNKLDNLGGDMKKLKEGVYAIHIGCQICEGPHLDKDFPLSKEVKQVEDAIFTNVEAPLYTPFYYSPEEIEYFSANSGFSDDDEFKNVTSIPDEDLKQTSSKQITTHYIESYVPPIPFPRRLEQHAEEALIYKTMESIKKITSNQPFLKEIRQSNEYPTLMKDLVANKTLTIENEDVRINRRCSALLLNQLLRKEKDLGSFILPCSIGRLDFNNALANLGASISIMPFFMYKHLGIGKLETIKMNIELVDNSKCIPKEIVRNLLIKIVKFILPIDFIVIHVLEDFRMPVILGRPLLVTAYAKVDVLKKSISLEVGNEKVIFKMKSKLLDMRNESVLMIKSNMIAEEDELMNIEFDLFTYITNTCESCKILAVDTDLFTYEESHTGAPRFFDKIMGFERHGHHATHQAKSVTGEAYAIKKFDVIGKRKRFGVDHDDNNDFYDPDQCDDGRNNEIPERIIHNLHEEWFKGTSNDEDDIEEIIDYLKPTSYDGFVDLDTEEYNRR
ncbi:hypothetical protein Tco_0383090 [Tanacetum coccineum]